MEMSEDDPADLSRRGRRAILPDRLPDDQFGVHVEPLRRSRTVLRDTGADLPQPVRVDDRRLEVLFDQPPPRWGQRLRACHDGSQAMLEAQIAPQQMIGEIGEGRGVPQHVSRPKRLDPAVDRLGRLPVHVPDRDHLMRARLVQPPEPVLDPLAQPGRRRSV